MMEMNEWREVKLDKVLEFGNGKVRPRTTGAIPIYGGNGILEHGDEYNYTGETIIIGRVGAYCGSVYYENGPIWISDNALSAKPKGDNNAKFLFYFLRYLDLNQWAGGSSHPLVTQSLLNSLEFKICLNPAEQKAIASVLSSLDDKIDLLHRQNETLEQMAEAMFRQWFVEEAEEEWEEVVITDLFEIRDGTHDSPKQSEVGKKLITTRHLSKYSIDFNNAYYISEEDYVQINKRSKVDTDDILYSMIGTIGEVYLEQSDNIDYAIKNIGLFKTSQNPIWKYYTVLWLKSNLGKEFIFENRSGSTQEYISLGSLRSIVFDIPSLKNIELFNDKIEPHFKKIRINQQQIHTLTQLRDTLLPKLMSGEVRVGM